MRLLRNEDGKRFADKSAEAGFDKLTGVFLGSAWVDLDQDGDLDAVLARYAADSDQAEGHQAAGGAGRAGQRRRGPAGAAGRAAAAADLQVPPGRGRWPPSRGPVTSFVASDLDADRDVDLLVLADGEPPAVVLNDRLLRFRRGAPSVPSRRQWNGGLVLDANGDEQSDLLLLSEPTGRSC